MPNPNPKETAFEKYLRVLGEFKNEFDRSHYRSIIIGWFAKNASDDFRDVVDIAAKKVRS